MFYYPLVLKRHTGCFSTVWLVATKGIRISRRDFLRVDVGNTCDDIMNYVLEQVPPPLPGLPRPRFSLYLSSQLQYGVVVVYHRQCAILLEELQSIVGQLVQQKTAQKIDMDEPSKQALDFPNALALVMETEGAPEPLFGVMQDVTLSPTTLIKMSEEYRGEASPDRPELAVPAAAELDSDLAASPDMITLRETEPVAIPVAEFEGEELVDQHPDTIDFLLAQTDQFPEGDLEIQRKEVSRREEEVEMERRGWEEDLEKERMKELTGSTLELQPTVSSEDAMLMPQEDTVVSAEKPEPPADQLTPVPLPILPSPPPAAKERKRPTLELAEGSPPEVKTRKRKRQLIFFDPVTQLSQEELQAQIKNPQTETRSPLLPLTSLQRMRSATEHFNTPCTSLPEELRFLWRQAATVTPLSGSNLQIGERELSSESVDSEKERDREMVEAAEREEERHEVSSTEVPRHLAEAEMFDMSDQGMLPLEGSDQREVSREISPVYTPERERTPVPRPVSALQDIPEGPEEFLEVPGELLERAADEWPGLLPELTEPQAEPVTFKSVLPPEANRRTVSSIFLRLLENLSAMKLRAEQDQPYGDILILPGHSYDDEVPSS